MSRRALNTSDTTVAPVRVRSPRVVGPTPDMVAKAREAFLANKQANAASQRARAATKELAKAMSKANIDNFEFMAELPSGGAVQARAAIEPVICDVISVEKLRGMIDDATFMRVVKATQGAVKEECGEHIAFKAMVTEERPPELKIKEIK
jgi:hypothetical protein